LASAFGHAFLAGTVSFWPSFQKLDARTKWLGIAFSVIPDLDVIAFRFGIPYEHVLGHRGLTHSLLFASLLAWMADRWFWTNHQLRRWLYLFICMASHGVLDAMTNGGRGVAFFAPVWNQRYFFPFRPVQVSPIHAGAFFSQRGLQILVSEWWWIGVPSLLLLFILWAIQAIKSRS